MNRSASPFRIRRPGAALVLASALSLASLLPVGAAEGDVWTLQDVNLNSAGTGVHPSVTILSQRLDSKGGFIEFQMGGDDGLNTCPGGSEQIRFSWDFGGDVFELAEGSNVGVTLNGEYLHETPPCTGHKAAQSRVTAAGTKGGSPSLPEAQLKVVDTDRFFAINDTIDSRFAFPSDEEGGRTGTTRTIHLDVYEPPVDRPYAYFIVQFGFFGAGVMQVAYIYKKGTDTPMQPALLSMELNFDRPGSDYRDFDLPEANAALCRSACAAEDICHAYTYVRPGIQGDAPRCWLKNEVPAGYASDCCVSGTR